MGIKQRWLSPINLFVGQHLIAWREYGQVRSRLKQIPAGPPIFLTGTHRSGTTWMGKMLAASGIWSVHEPFAPKKKGWHENFTYIRTDDEHPEAAKHFSRVLNGGFQPAWDLPHATRLLGPLRVLPQPIHRVLIKDPLACLMTGFLTRKFNLRTLILFRHPCGFVSSVTRLGWPLGPFLRQFLGSPQLMQDHLAPYKQLLTSHANEESLQAAAVLHGCLNRVLWNLVEQNVGTPLVFEELCSDPLPQCESLFADLGLPYDDRVRTIHEKLCFGEERPVEEYRTHEVARNSSAMADSWKRKLDSSQVEETRRIWDQFGIPLYIDDESWTL